MEIFEDVLAVEKSFGGRSKEKTQRPYNAAQTHP